jgi:XTP/dITP diphosphohydrolase
MIDRLVIATKNPDKLREIGDVLVSAGLVGEIVAGLAWPDVEETGATLEENALLKAEAVAAATGLPALADDTGLEVAALGGAPGVHTARFARPEASYADNVERLLEVMHGVDSREAVFRTVIALVEPGGRALTAEGRLEGRIARVRRGDNGFGYDPVFEVDRRTLAEMPSEEKNLVSHRAKAIRALATALS